jgi:hypothetical protein
VHEGAGPGVGELEVVLGVGAIWGADLFRRGRARKRLSATVRFGVRVTGFRLEAQEAERLSGGRDYWGRVLVNLQ